MLRDARGAVDDCADALRIDPRSAEARELRALARADMGDLAGAYEDLEARFAQGDVPLWLLRLRVDVARRVGRGYRDWYYLQMLIVEDVKDATGRVQQALDVIRR